MRSVLSRYNYFFLLLLIFLLSELIVNPIGDFPLNDDWSYGKAVYYSINQSFTIGEFGAMTLFTHLGWGMIFVKIFGFSFTVLRVSTFVSVVTGLFFLDKIVFNSTGNKLAGFLAGLVLLFNPLFFNLSNTFMTDVNFNTLLIICTYCALSYFQTQRIHFLIVFFLMSCLLVLLRQFGILLPLCFTAACFFAKEKRILKISLAIVGTVIVYITFKLYENYLAEILSKGAAYKFSGGIHLSDPEFRKTIINNFKNRYGVVLVHILIYSAPFAMVFLNSLYRKTKRSVALILAALCFCLSFVLFEKIEFPYHNVFTNMSLGPETFYESIVEHSAHIQRDYFQTAMLLIKFVFSALTLWCVALYLQFLINSKSTNKIFKPQILFLFSFLLAYAAMLFITESYFDRYHIPFITVSLIILSYIAKEFSVNYKLAIVPLVLFFYIAVMGTKDYLSWNRLKWEAYEHLQKSENVTANKVNAGFELNCWNDLQPTWWSDFLSIKDHDYVIQFSKPEGFSLVKEYEFQRYFPYMKDRINIYKKDLTPLK